MWYTPFSPSRSPWWTVSIRICPGSPLGSGLARSPIGRTDGLVLVTPRASPSWILFLRRLYRCATDIIEMFLYSSWPYSWYSRSSILLVAGPLRQSWSSSVLASNSMSPRLYFSGNLCRWYLCRRNAPLLPVSPQQSLIHPAQHRILESAQNRLHPHVLLLPRHRLEFNPVTSLQKLSHLLDRSYFRIVHIESHWPDDKRANRNRSVSSCVRN